MARKIKPEDFTRERIQDLLKRSAPIMTGWADRTLSMFHADPVLPGMWRNCSLGEDNFTWPVALHASQKIGGVKAPIHQAKEFTEYQDTLSEHGFKFGATFDDVKAARGHIHGIVVPIRVVRAQSVQDAPYLDGLLVGNWIPFAQVWRFKAPISYPYGTQTMHYGDVPMVRILRDAMDHAERIR